MAQLAGDRCAKRAVERNNAGAATSNTVHGPPGLLHTLGHLNGLMMPPFGDPAVSGVLTLEGTIETEGCESRVQFPFTAVYGCAISSPSMPIQGNHNETFTHVVYRPGKFR